MTTKGRRGCVIGQGELKRGGYDPLFALNLNYALSAIIRCFETILKLSLGEPRETAKKKELLRPLLMI